MFWKYCGHPKCVDMEYVIHRLKSGKYDAPEEAKWDIQMEEHGT